MVPKPTPAITSRHMEGEGIADGGELDQRKRTHSIKNGFHCVHQWRRKGGSEREKGGVKDKEKKYDVEGGRTYINKQTKLHHIDHVFSQGHIHRAPRSFERCVNHAKGNKGHAPS